MSNLYLVRHGQASFGSRDYDQLSPLGVKQSELLGQWLAGTGLKPGHVIIGTLRRHRQTADACLAQWLTEDRSSFVPRVDSAFNEFDHKEVLLRCHSEFAEPGYLERFLSEHADGRRAFQKVFAESVERWVAGQYPGDYVESWPEFRARSVAGLLRAAESAPDHDVWIFTSGGPIAAITQHVLGVPDANVLDLNWSVLNTSVSQFTHRRRTTLKQFNSVAHLTLPGRTELFTYR